MSEFQYVGFRALDAPVSGEDLDYMHEQSSRADVTPWSFDNEYHYGDFRGNALEMLRRGYDVHLHYANFGIRKLAIRLPFGFPDFAAARQYLVGDSLQFEKDQSGPGGTLVIQPYDEGLDDPLWDLDEWLDSIAEVRSEILDGDLRPLYLAHLAISSDSDHDPEESREAAVPAGLDDLTEAQQSLADFYGISDALIAAAAQDSPPLSSNISPQTQYIEWVRSQSEAIKDEWLAQLMADSHAPVRGELLAKFRAEVSVPSWPTTRPNRTIAELWKRAEEIERDEKRKAADKAARERAKKLADMAADPDKYMSETETLVAQRSTTSYRAASDLLADLREALTGTPQAGLAEKQAKKLKKMHPTLHHLTAQLRRNGFVPK